MLTNILNSSAQEAMADEKLGDFRGHKQPVPCEEVRRKQHGAYGD